MISDAQIIGVISDIHANYVALEAVLNDMAGRHVDTLFFLGDYITDGPDPQRTLRLLHEAAHHFRTFFIRGNREQYLIDHTDHPHEVWKKGPSSGALLYTYERLSAQDIEWFRSMPICHSFQDFILCHGSPGRVNELLDVTPSAGENTLAWLRQIEKPFLLCGHTHRQGIFCRQGRTLLNAGSVGLPHHHDPSACAALLFRTSHRHWKSQLLCIPYDTQAIIDAYYASELMDMAPAWSHANCRFIATGHNYILRLLSRTKALAAMQHGPSSLSEIDEAIWMQAAADLDLFSH